MRTALLPGKSKNPRAKPRGRPISSVAPMERAVSSRVTRTADQVSSFMEKIRLTA